MIDNHHHARGRTITEQSARHERNARKNALLWSVVRAAVQIADESVFQSRGLYAINPSLMLRIREAVDRIRPELKRMDAELEPVED